MERVDMSTTEQNGRASIWRGKLEAFPVEERRAADEAYCARAAVRVSEAFVIAEGVRALAAAQQPAPKGDE